MTQATLQCVQCLRVEYVCSFAGIAASKSSVDTFLELNFSVHESHRLSLIASVVAFAAPL